MAESSGFSFGASPATASGTQTHFSFGSAGGDCCSTSQGRRYVKVVRKPHQSLRVVKPAELGISDDGGKKSSFTAANGSGGFGPIFNFGKEKDSIFNNLQETSRKECDVEKPQTEEAKKENSAEDKKTVVVRRETNQETDSHSSLPVTIFYGTLKGIPQNPHFYPLLGYTDLTRKHLMTGWDRAFEETLVQIQSLKPTDFQVKVGEVWKQLGELQTMGYNVIPLRRRVVELSDVMKQLKLTQRKINILKIKGENHRLEKCRLEYIIMDLQAMTVREEKCMERVMSEISEMEENLPKFEDLFSKVAIKPV